MVLYVCSKSPPKQGYVAVTGTVDRSENLPLPSYSITSIFMCILILNVYYKCVTLLNNINKSKYVVNTCGIYIYHCTAEGFSRCQRLGHGTLHAPT